MRALTGQDEMLFLGEGGPVSRLVALFAGLDGREPEALRALPLAVWEAELITLRARVIGARVEAELACPACAAGVLLVFDVTDLPRELPPPPERAPLPLRALTVGDLADLEASGESGEAALAFLLARAGDLGSAAAAAARLAGADRAALTEALEALVAGLSLELGSRCTECAAEITAPFDIAGFLDAELTERAARLLDEVHLMASTYHWSEREILSLTFARRQDYIGRILAERTLAGRAAVAA